MEAGLPLPTRMPSLRQTRPQMPPAAQMHSVASDDNGLPNSARAAGTQVMIGSLADTSKMNGLGGRLDLLG